MGHPDAQFQPAESPRRPYLRSMQGWWMKERVYRIYMLRELTAVAVALFALEVLAGLVALGSGASDYAGWLAFLAHPLVRVLNILLLALMVFHAWSWFDIMPKTMPPVVINGKRLPDVVISRTGQAVFLGITLIGLALALL